MKPSPYSAKSPVPRNKHYLVGQKALLKLKEIWAIRLRLQLAEKTQDLALFNLAIDSKLCGCDLVGLRHSSRQDDSTLALVMQRKTRQSEQFEITKQIRQSTFA